jgi:hypothetical protein
MLDESKPKIFGLDTLERNSKDIYLLEGPIDSLFVDNAIAAAGGDLLSQVETLGLQKEQIVVVFDNEPRNAEVVSKIEKSINAGYRTTLWPEYIEQKDVNDMILAGYTSDQIKNIIDSNTTSGLEAKLKFAIWRKDK